MVYVAQHDRNTLFARGCDQINFKVLFDFPLFIKESYIWQNSTLTRYVSQEIVKGASLIVVNIKGAAAPMSTPVEISSFETKSY